MPLIGLGLVVVAAGTITAVLATQTGQTGSPTSVSPGIWSVAFNRDGTILASAGNDHTVRLWNPTTHKQLGQPFQESNTLFTVALSPDGKVVASGGYNQTVDLWNTATHDRIATFGLQSSRVDSVAFSPDGKLLASGDDDGTVLVRDLATRDAIVGNINPRSGPVNSVAFSPDGKLLASGSQSQDGKDGKMELWNTTTRGSAAIIDCQNPVLSVAFSHDGKIVACATEGSQVLLWTTATGKLKIPPIPICASWVASVAFSPVSDIFATGCGDVRWWNANSGQQIGKSV